MRTRLAFCSFVVTSLVALSWAAPARAADASAYRGFRLGMTVAEVAAAAGVAPATVKTAYDRPRLIQELEWSPPGVPSGPGVLPEQDSVTQVLFGFCDGTLYRIVVSYAPDKTEGLTEQDLVDALSVGYGPVARPSAKIITSAASQGYLDTEDVLARWEDATASVNLFARAYRQSFGLVVYSKRLAPIVRAAIVEGTRLKDLDAPRRDVAEQKSRDDIEQASHAKMRVANKAAFRY
jgi:hypothetical protein